MKRQLVAAPLVAVAVAVTASSTASAESDLMKRLDKALESAVAFRHGGDTGPLREAESAVLEASGDAGERRAAEERLLGALAKASTREARGFICRQLRTVGSARSVPALERLLTDPELSHMARYALYRIDDPAAVDALRRGLGATSGRLQAGIVNTLANRGCVEARRDFVRLVRSPDAGVAEAAARALGRVGGADAVRALRSARARAGVSKTLRLKTLRQKTLRQRIDNALLVAADGLLADGRADEAARLYEEFYAPNQPLYLRLAGLRGLAASRGERALSLLVKVVREGDPFLRRNAISFMGTIEGRRVTDALVELLPSQPPEGQELVLNALGTRGDPAAVPAICAAMKSESEPVRLAAVDALGKAGDASAVPLLAEAAAASGGREQAAARAGFVRLRGDDIDPALMRSVREGPAKVRSEIIRALAGRKVAGAVDALLEAARDDDADVRREAIRALGAVARGDDVPSLVALAVDPKDPGDRSDLERAIATVFRRIDDKDRQADPVLMALDLAPTDAKPVLIRLLGRPATGDALSAVRAAVGDADSQVRDAAVRALSDWPNPEPAEDLLTIARTSDSKIHSILALRGYVRLAGMSDEPTAMYVRAMELADRPDDRKLVLGGLGTADSAEALALVERYLDDPALRTEAAQAVVKIAGRLRKRDGSRAKAALENVVAAVRDARVAKQARDIINAMEQFEGYIRVWLAAGPYREKGNDSRAVFDKAYPPEDPDATDATDAKDVEWKRLTQGVGSWDINLENTFGSMDYCAAYMRTRVVSPREQDAQLELGSDDAIKVWLNGRPVHANYQTRGLSPRQDIVKVKLREGYNDLLLKVVDHQGGWAFCCRIRDGEGGALEGLRFEAR